MKYLIWQIRTAAQLARQADNEASRAFWRQIRNEAIALVHITRLQELIKQLV